MPKEYKLAPKPVRTVTAKLLKKYHEELSKAEIDIAIVFVNAGQDKTGFPIPAIVKNGKICAAKIGNTTTIHRVCGLADVIMQIDEQIWDKLRTETRDALIDHELTHLEISKDKDGYPMTDAAGRPVIQMKPHDVELGIFQEIVARHKAAAIDSHVIQALYESPAGQTAFGFYKTSLKNKAQKPSEPPKKDAPAPKSSPGGKSKPSQPKPAPKSKPLPISPNGEIAKAAKIFLETQRASTSSIQRRLKIGFPHASRIMDELEEAGCIGPPRGSEPRELFEDKLKLKASV